METLFRMDTFYNIKNKNIFPWSTNKAVVRKPKLSHCTLDERRWIKSQGLIELRRISIKREDKTNPNRYIVTPHLSSYQKKSIKVNQYIHSPLRCYKCQKYWHHIVDVWDEHCVRDADKRHQLPSWRDWMCQLSWRSPSMCTNMEESKKNNVK